MKTPFASLTARRRAGRFGMVLFLIALGVLFAATCAGLIVVRIQLGGKDAWPRDLPPLPWGLAASTAVLLLSSVSMQYAVVRSAVADADGRGSAAVRRALVLTTALGVVFVALQTACWLVWFDRTEGRWAGSDAWRLALTGFYVLTGLHAAHVLGGLIALVWALARAGTSPSFARDTIHSCAMYWHFLGAVWLCLLAMLLIWQ